MSNLPPNVVDLPAGVDSLAEWKEKTTTFTLDALSAQPETREILCGRYPIRATSGIVAMGGTGKTTWSIMDAMPHLTDDFHVLYITAEDDPEDYQNKAHNILYGEFNPVSPEDVAGKIHILNLKGEGAKLVQEQSGTLVPSVITDKVIQYIEEVCPRARLVIFETASRFGGGEENAHFEAMISACDRIAIAINGAVVLVHHMGKGQARDKVIDIYAGRGGSTFGDNTRSMTVLTRIDDAYKGAETIVVDPEDIEHKLVFEVSHARLSYGKELPPEYFIFRRGPANGPSLEPVPIATEDEVLKAKVNRLKSMDDAAAAKIKAIIKNEGGAARKNLFDTGTMELIGLAQKPTRALIEVMLENGELEEAEMVPPESKSKQKAKYLKVSS